MTTRSRRLAWIAVIAAVLCASLIRLRIADMPLERDEGEYAYAGQLILQGIPPYQLAYNMKFPGTYYAYSLILAMLGPSARAVHVGLMLVNAATILLLFQLGRRLLGDLAGTIGAIAFAVLSLDPWIAGPTAHATHFVLLPLLGGVLVLDASLASRRIAAVFAGSVLLGTGVLMKQQAAFAVLAVLAAFWWNTRRSLRTVSETARTGGVVAAGIALPFALLCGVLAAQGVLGRFWFWTFTYARAYISEVPISEAPATLAMAIGFITQADAPLWMLSGVGFLALWVTKSPTSPKSPRSPKSPKSPESPKSPKSPESPNARVLVTALAIGGFVAASPGFYFRPHYFILLLPAVALCVGAAIASLARLVRFRSSAAAGQWLAIGVFAAALGAYAVKERDYLFTAGPRAISKTLSGANPFVESEEIARYIQARTNPSDRIAVLGSEPQIYFAAGRISATAYIYTYPLMEPQPYASAMQDEMMQQVEAAHPKYVVVMLARSSWMATPKSDQRILLWTQRYADACYERVGAGDISGTETTSLKWDADALGYQPATTNQVHIFRRKGDEPCTAPR